MSDSGHQIGDRRDDEYWLACHIPTQTLVRVAPAYPLPEGCMKVTGVRMAPCAWVTVYDRHGRLMPGFWGLEIRQ